MKSPFDAAVGQGAVPPELDVVDVARASMTASLGSMDVAEVRSLSRLSSANHDLIKPKPRARNPFAAAFNWWASWGIPGMGMFSEAYMVFSLGNVKPLWAVYFPSCFGTAQPPDCNQTAVEQIETIEIAGIICGMVIIGAMADWMGRKWGSRLTMSIMLLGGILLSSATGSAEAFLTVLSIGLMVYGIGVGGEYPLASSSAAERAEGNPEMRKRRGETVVLTFSQQGWGNLANTLVIVILMAMQGATGSVVTPTQASITWHTQYAIGTFICLLVMLYRWIYLEESKVWSAERKGIDRELVFEGETAHSPKPYVVIIKRYWSRLLITAGAWMVNDLAFYGNKLFINQFINIISPSGATLFSKMLWTLLNSGVSLCGYIVAAFLVDRPWYGRMRMQAIGFSMMFILFGACAIWYDTLILPSYIHVFQFLYFFSSFWNQMGPNCTTFLVAGEVFPTDVRAFFHGISAACGKAGAIAATQLFNHLSSRNTFIVSAAAGAFGAFFTFVFLPDTTGLDLSEIDRHHRYLLAGQDRHYHGEAVNPRYLSLWERLAGYGRTYDPQADRDQAKLQAMAHEANLYPVDEEGESLEGDSPPGTVRGEPQ